ncbi:hypothetical protein Hanom_Chr15g01405171 [Helianthus anomalus]
MMLPISRTQTKTIYIISMDTTHVFSNYTLLSLMLQDAGICSPFLLSRKSNYRV